MVSVCCGAIPVKRTRGYCKRCRKWRVPADAALGLEESAGRRRGEPIGSGPVEATCQQTQCRFKRPGQFWSQEGDEALLCLEMFWRNGRWHLLFPHASRLNPARN